MASTRYTVSLDPVGDSRYIRKLELEPNTSAAIRAAIIAYYDRPTHQDLAGQLDQVLDALRGVKVLQAGAAASDPEHDQAEPARARANLDKMKARFRR